MVGPDPVPVVYLRAGCARGLGRVYQRALPSDLELNQLSRSRLQDG